jgi:hypothetical protein
MAKPIHYTGEATPKTQPIKGMILAKIVDYAFPILNIVVPQSGQEAFNAGFPFFIVTACGLSTSFFALHFTQYIVAITHSPPLL